ncbi:2143_t:CDS:2 [Dentiscutata erythropus]|uniref:2143_t:CDS:1 n=1 Tax=Dentiscutata erythropus TaxID=1348616 RepID=A0A9N8WPC8_9GLOM|nr:2143_t:CDS:2 [Dentiscutata erythropus]
MSSKKQKNTLNNEQRKEVIEFKDKNPNISHVDLATWVKNKFNLEVHPTTIGRLVKNKDDIGDNPTKKRQKHKTFAKILKIPNDNLKFSHGWLFKFKRRHGLEQIKKHGEDSSVDDNVVAIAVPQLKEILKEYSLKDIYNMDETGLFYRLPTHGASNISNATSSVPHMGQVILLVDNAKCHFSSNLNLRNTTTHYLPPNTTSRLQPLDADIIMSFKHRYKNYFIKWLLDQYESVKDDKLNVLNAIKFVIQAWKEVSSETVRNCFQHTEILPVQNNEYEEPINDDDDYELMEEMKIDIELLNFRNAMDLEVYINYPEEKDTSEVLNDQEIVTLVTNVEATEDLGEGDNSEEDEDDSKEISMITHHEALNAIEVLEQYLMQQDLSDKARLEHDQALLNLQKGAENAEQILLR